MKKRERICKTLIEKVVALETYPYQLDEKDKFLLYHLKMILKSGSDDKLLKPLTEEELKDVWAMIQYSTRKNIQYGDHLFDKIKLLNENAQRSRI